MKKKLAAAGIVVFILFVLFFPIKAHLDDGGSVVYTSIAKVYKITKIKTFDNVGMTITMKEGLRVELFGKEVYQRIDKEYLLEQKEWGEENGTDVPARIAPTPSAMDSTKICSSVISTISASK